jgi:hypothetical protein
MSAEEERALLSAMLRLGVGSGPASPSMAYLASGPLLVETAAFPWAGSAGAPVGPGRAAAAAQKKHREALSQRLEAFGDRLEKACEAAFLDAYTAQELGRAEVTDAQQRARAEAAHAATADGRHEA